MLCAALFSCLLALSLAGDHAAPQAACQPKHETILVTRTNVNTVFQQVTVYDYQYDDRTVDVTSVVLVPSPLVLPNRFTTFHNAGIKTLISQVTTTVFQTRYKTALATAVHTETSWLLATAVEVQQETITQTAVVPQTVTQTITIGRVDDAFTTLTVTRKVDARVTKTDTKPVFVTATSYVKVPVLATSTQTHISTHTVQATSTVTRNEFVTMCYLPKITYSH